jgi:hypothetical protein
MLIQKPTALPKNWKNELAPSCDSEANFFAASTVLKAVAMGVVLAVSFFWPCKANPAVLAATRPSPPPSNLYLPQKKWALGP